jgi:hypothetical protein
MLILGLRREAAVIEFVLIKPLIPKREKVGFVTDLFTERASLPYGNEALSVKT